MISYLPEILTSSSTSYVRSFVRSRSLIAHLCARINIQPFFPTFSLSLPFKIHAPIERLGETRELQKGVATRGWLNKFKLGVFETFPFPSGTKVKRRVLQLRNCPGDKVEGRLQGPAPSFQAERRDMEVTQRRPNPPSSFHRFSFFFLTLKLRF